MDDLVKDEEVKEEGKVEGSQDASLSQEVSEGKEEEETQEAIFGKFSSLDEAQAAWEAREAELAQAKEEIGRLSRQFDLYSQYIDFNKVAGEPSVPSEEDLDRPLTVGEAKKLFEETIKATQQKFETVQQQTELQQQLQKIHDDFYATHKDLEKHKLVVKAAMQEVVTEHPNAPLENLLKLTAERARAQLGLTKRKTGPGGGVPGVGSTPPADPLAGLSEEEREIAELLED